MNIGIMPEAAGNLLSHIYKCPYESCCEIHKHCHALETTEELLYPITIMIKCPALHGVKIPVEIGA